MQLADKAAILAIRPKLEEVAVPELGDGCGVCLRTMTGWERSEIEKRFSDGRHKEDPGGLRAALLVRTIADGTGKRIFEDGDGRAVLELPAGVVERLFEAAARINGFTQRDVEGLEKN